jgi:hypothetical protein
MRKATILAVAVLLCASASAYAETAQVKTPDGRIVTCNLPPKNTNQTGTCSDGEVVMWGDYGLVISN